MPLTEEVGLDLNCKVALFFSKTAKRQKVITNLIYRISGQKSSIH